MEKTIQYEKRLDLKLLLVSVLRKWRAMVVLAVVFGALLGVFGFLALPDGTPVHVLSEKEILEEEEIIAERLDTAEYYGEYILEQKAELKACEKEYASYQKAKEKLLKLSKWEYADLAALVDMNALLKDANDRIEWLRKDVASLEKEVENLEADAEARQEAVDEMYTPERSYLSVAVKAVLGAVLGVLLVSVVAAVKYIFDDRLQNEKDITELFGLMVLGSVYTGKSAKAHRGIDKLLDELEGVGRQAAEAEEYAVAAAKLQVLSKASDKLLLTGTLSAEALAQVKSRLAEQLPGYELEAAENLCGNARGICLLPQCKVVLVEAVGASQNRDVIAVMELLRQSGTQVLGAFLV